MFVVMLKFADRSKAPALMEGHNAWLREGFDAGVFLLAGGIRPQEGGAVIAHGVSRDELAERVGNDPFVAEGVVDAQIIEIAPGRVDERLAFLAN